MQTRSEQNRIRIIKTLGGSIVPILLALQAIFFPAIARAAEDMSAGGLAQEYLQCIDHTRHLT